MTLVVESKTTISAGKCEKCEQSLWSDLSFNKIIKCNKCGATYKVMSEYCEKSNIKLECEFSEFRCTKLELDGSTCQNVCPAQDMFCQAHLSDSCYNSIKSCIQYYEDVVITQRKQLDKMDESKKIWLIQELSGLEEFVLVA
jgi:hypothetical protein